MEENEIRTNGEKIILLASNSRYVSSCLVNGKKKLEFYYDSNVWSAEFQKFLVSTDFPDTVLRKDVFVAAPFIDLEREDTPV